MFLATVIVSVLLAALLVYSASRKLTHQQRIVQPYRRVGVPERKLDYLAAILLIGAAGLLLGLWWEGLGVAAAGGVVCYFALAITAHIRASDTRNLPIPLAYALIAVAALTLRLATL
jgi:DoxX-like family